MLAINRFTIRNIIPALLFLLICWQSPSAQTTYQVRLEQFHDVTQGSHQQVKLYIHNVDSALIEPGGFNFLIKYDPFALSLTDVVGGQMITDCGWELFTYSYYSNALCDGLPCPSGTVRITALADNIGGNTPSCFLDSSGHLATLDLLVSDDRSLECAFVPINFVWYDCGDNTFSSVSAESLFISQSVFDTTGTNDISDPNDGTPTIKGAQDIDCTPGPNGPYRMIDFTNGGLTLACDSVITDIINESNSLPLSFKLHQNYPNPFNPSTTFEFELAKAGSYSIEIIDITGRKVTTINGHGHVGHNSVSWDGSGNSSGLYLYKLSSSDFVQSRKMLLLK